MLSVETKYFLKELFVAIGAGEIDIEKQRWDVGKIINFEPYSAFQRIDRQRVGFIDSNDLLCFLKDNDFNKYTEVDTYYLLKFFDVDDDDKLNYTEFLTMILPCNSMKLRAAITQRPNYFVGPLDFLSQTIEYELCRLFMKEISLHRKTEKIKKHISVCADFDYDSGFKAVDDWGYGYIDFNNLRRFLRKCDYAPLNKELSAIIRRLDLDADGRLNFEEFVDGIKPNEPFSKLTFGSSKSKKKCKSVNRKPRKIMTAKGKKKQTIPMRFSKYDPSPYLQNQSVLIDYPGPYGDSLLYPNHILVEAKIPNRVSSRGSPQRNYSKSPERYGHDFCKEWSPLREKNYVNPHKLPKSITRRPRDISDEENPHPRSPPRGFISNNETLRNIEEKELVFALNELWKAEDDLERHKIDLSLMHDFNLIDLFAMFDLNNKGFVTFEEFRAGIGLFGHFPSTDDALLLFTRFDSLKEEVLRYSSFCDMFCPKTKEYWASLSKRKALYLKNPYLNIKEFFAPETRITIEYLIADSLKVESMAEWVRQHLSSIPSFNIMEAFNTLDMKNIGFITHKQLKLFLESHGFLTKNIHVSQLLDRFDKNKDGKVSYVEFADEMKPRSPIRRVGL